MSRIKNIIANLPLYPAFAIRYLSDKLFVFSFRLHMTLGTEAGVRIKDLDETMNKLRESIEQQMSSGSNKKKSSGIKMEDKRYNKLATIIKGSNGSGNSSN